MAEPVWSMGFRCALRVIAPAGRRSRLSVLIYHRVLPKHDPLQPGEPTLEEFERQLRWVKEWFNVLQLSEAVARLRAGSLPDRPMAITFDDGYADNHDLALPVLRRVGLPATFFVATSFLDGGRMFNDTVIESLRRFRGSVLDLRELELGQFQTSSDEEKRDAVGFILRQVKYMEPGRRSEVVEQIREIADAHVPGDLMMTSAQVAALVACGMEVGAHTATHPILARVKLQQAREEITRGRMRLEQICGCPVSLFAYPNGQPNVDYARATVSLVQDAGFNAAVSTSHGAAVFGTDPYQLPRFTPWSRQGWRYAAQLWKNLAHVRPRFADA